jgi:LacI family transcriptional regulator
MKQIANRAGVSISTVSLVLNNRDIAAELGYLTNRLASGLRTSSTRTIGFLSDEVATTPFAGRMIEGAQDAARMPAFFDKHPDVDGFFCFNDTRAWAIYTEATRRGLIIGKDIAVVGVDNHQVVAEALDPPLSTVELPHYEMGYWAVGKLVSLIEGEVPDPFPRAGYPVEKVQPPLSEQSPQLECQLRIKQSWVRPRSQR